MEGLFEKLAEETAELREELKASPFAGPPGTGSRVGKPQFAAEVHARLEDEVGICSLCW